MELEARWPGLSLCHQGVVYFADTAFPQDVFSYAGEVDVAQVTFECSRWCCLRGVGHACLGGMDKKKIMLAKGVKAGLSVTRR